MRCRAGTLAMDLDALIADPDIFPQRLDREARRILFVKLDEAQIRDASFLDDRVLRPDMMAAWIPLDALLAARPKSRSRPAAWIFHIGHCGSTLLSRLLPAIAPMLPIREPQALRALAEARRHPVRDPVQQADGDWQRLFDLILSLFSRGYRPDQTALIKSTSDCNALIEPALAADPGSRAVLMYVSLRNYLATMIVDGQPRPDVDGHVATRLHELQPLLDEPGSLLRQDLAPEHRAAVVWLSGVAQLDQARRALPDRVMTLDFDEFLQNVPTELARTARFLGATVDGGTVAEAIAGPVMRTNAKAPDRPFTPSLRSAKLAANYASSREQIDEGMRWADSLASGNSRLAGVARWFPFGSGTGSG